MTVQEAARLGGLAKLAKHGKQVFAEMGRKGGNAVVEKYGVEYMRKIAVVGGNAWADKYFDPAEFYAPYYKR